ncbi:serine/threonine-protein kinase [Stigmatella sp. ncwal1]|uniref:non-specific serine/threonine protein kinase n=1 Tax=Stigmatella ashevillensis TaxID=2995309 RepID=A0ABT5DLT1_9BACT|nr:serine/threonine-protein kinase [Stigmatella ashevillena]MDC0714563.1 serine/threonine-protein kinase [Stigmatella ashevillena]
MLQPPLPPDTLWPETEVGSWRLLGRAGCGTYGAVYRAVPSGQEPQEHVALKLALYPGDKRFEREAELLSRIHHPAVPRLRERGEWVGGPWGKPYPYLVMDWVEGAPLYHWARSTRPTTRQIFRLLAQLGHALQATHDVGCLHRDVKGDNVLVGPEGVLTLVDFGCGTYPGATPLTEGPLAPGTRPYRSPQALRHQRSSWRNRTPYEASPADDVYAMGVTAYRMVTGVYPPLSIEKAVRPTPCQLNPHVRPELSVLIERMLSESPRKRGSAEELAHALEAAAVNAGPEADVPFVITEQVRTQYVLPPTRRGAPSRLRELARLTPALAAVAAYVLLSFFAMQDAPTPAWAFRAGIGLEETRMAGMADAAVDASYLLPLSQWARRAPTIPVFAYDMPSRPLKHQKRPPCTRRGETEINGGCWVRLDLELPCKDGGYEWKGRCYMPMGADERPDSSRYP